MKKSLENKKASLIIACRNEKDFISACLDSVLSQSYPKDLTEIFVIDGESDDGTRDIVKSYSDKYPNLKMLDNKKRIQPHAFNMGIKASGGDYVLIMGAHNKYPKNYVSKCISVISASEADNVGGRIEAKTNKSNLLALAIIGTYISPFGIGNATFRKNTKKPVYVDTVFGGCYRREVFERIGYYNEKLKRSQDMELNLRLVRSGGKILMDPTIVSYYYPKDTFWEFVKYSFRAGKGPVRAVKITGKSLKPMHYAPAAFVGGLLLGPATFWVSDYFLYFYISVLVVYLILAILYSLQYASRRKSVLLFLLMPIMFLFKHFFYGLGSLYGSIKTND